MTVALITGITGQDGPYLAEQLLAAGVEVHGLSRSGQVPASIPDVRPVRIDMRDQDGLQRAIAVVRPDEVYHLAAVSSVGASWDDPAATGDVTGLGTARLLEAVRRRATGARVFVASSSEVFGEPEAAPQDEATPIRPVSPYGAAKAFGHHLARIYRRRYGLHVAVGILYNHESPRRPPAFVTRKITLGAAAIARGEANQLRLGNLDARRDWGFARDYARAMRLIMAYPEPGEFVVATGTTHTVREWCDLAFRHFGLDYRNHVVVDEALWRHTEPVPVVGDASKARRLLGWRPTVDFAGLVELMMDAESAGG